MPRYLEVAAEANLLAERLVEMVPLDKRGEVAEIAARLINYGIRCNPRPAQSTVRLNAVRRAVRGLPVKVGMLRKEDPKTGKGYNILTTQPTGGKETEESSQGGDE
jgi:hypothetical protein